MAAGVDDGAAGRALACSSLGPFGRKVQPASNTQFEFDWRHPGDLDKIPISQHAGDASLKTRFGFERWG
jgi:hypothetical protein